MDLFSHPPVSAGGSEATLPLLSFPTGRGGAAEAFSLPAPALLLGCPQVLIPPRLSQILPVSAPSLINVSAASATRAAFFLGPSASYIPLFQADSDGKKTAHAAHKRDETKMKGIEGEKRGGIFPLKHSNKYSAMII